MPEHVLALDLGTTGVRALVVHASGRVVGHSWQPLDANFPIPGWVEQDPGQMWDRSVEVMRGSLVDSGLEAVDIAALGVVNQRSTAIAWESGSGEALHPALGWQDTRTSARVAELVALGIPVNTLASCTKFEWMLQNVSTIREAGESHRLQLGTPDVWLTSQLTGGEVFVTDMGNAGCTGLLDAGSRSWFPLALDLFGIAEQWLPSLVPSSAVVGEMPKQILGAAIPVAARAGDQQAASFAQAVHAEGDAKLTLGTAAMLNLNTANEARVGPPGTYALPLWELAVGECVFCLEGTVITAGAVVDWLVELEMLPEPAALDRVAGSVEHTDGVFFVPALQGLGTPLLDDEARGMWGGLTRGSSGAHLVRAALEGIAHRCADVVAALPGEMSTLRVDGGLAQSDLLLQRIADFTGCEIHRAAQTETTALGAAFLALLAVDLLESPSEILGRLLEPQRFFPELEETERRRVRQDWGRALSRSQERGHGASQE